MHDEAHDGCMKHCTEMTIAEYPPFMWVPSLSFILRMVALPSYLSN